MPVVTRHVRRVRAGDHGGADRWPAQPAELAALAVSRIIKNKRGALERALTGRFTGHHAARLEMLLTQHDQLTALIDQVTTRIDQAITALPPGPARRSRR